MRPAGIITTPVINPLSISLLLSLLPSARNRGSWNDVICPRRAESMMPFSMRACSFPAICSAMKKPPISVAKAAPIMRDGSKGSHPHASDMVSMFRCMNSTPAHDTPIIGTAMVPIVTSPLSNDSASPHLSPKVLSKNPMAANTSITAIKAFI